MSKLSDKTDDLRNEVVKANDIFLVLKQELMGQGVREDAVPSLVKLQKVLMRANTESSILTERVQALYCS